MLSDMKLTGQIIRNLKPSPKTRILMKLNSALPIVRSYLSSLISNLMFADKTGIMFSKPSMAY